MHKSRRNLLEDSNAGVADKLIYCLTIRQTGGGMQAVCGMISQKLKALCAATAIGTLSACAAASSYMGIEFAPVAVASSEQSEIQSLARRAQGGDNRAQLELGIRFEEGHGVVRDLEKAKMLFELAAKDTPIKQTSFIAEGGIVKAETTYVGVQKGLIEASRRLAMLYRSTTWKSEQKEGIEILNDGAQRPSSVTVLIDDCIKNKNKFGLSFSCPELHSTAEKSDFMRIQTNYNYCYLSFDPPDVTYHHLYDCLTKGTEQDEKSVTKEYRYISDILFGFTDENSKDTIMRFVLNNKSELSKEVFSHDNLFYRHTFIYFFSERSILDTTGNIYSIDTSDILIFGLCRSIPRTIQSRAVNSANPRSLALAKICASRGIDIHKIRDGAFDAEH